MEWLAREMGGRAETIQSVARIRGLEKTCRIFPGAYAPGFMPAPALQAQKIITNY